MGLCVSPHVPLAWCSARMSTSCGQLPTGRVPEGPATVLEVARG